MNVIAYAACGRRSLARLLLALVAALAATTLYGQAIAGAADPPAGTQDDKDKKSEADKPPPLTIKCVFVRDHELIDSEAVDKWFARDRVHTEPPRKAADAMATAQTKMTDPPVCTSTDKTLTSGELVGAGDLEIVLSREHYDAAVAHGAKNRKSLVVYVNGVALPNDALQETVRHSGGNTYLRYRIKPGKDTQGLWAMLYRSGGFTVHEDLHVALGWPGFGPTSTPQASEGTASVAITNGLKLLLAILFLLLLAAVTYVVGWKTDVLRDAPLPDWWKKAQRLHATVASAKVEDANAHLKAEYADYDPAAQDRYTRAAAVALAGFPVPAEKQTDTIIGLALRRATWSPVRAAFSLGRTQLAMWFSFAVASGIFLWIIYGELPPIDGSILALVGLSVATTGVSLVSDRNAGGRDYTPSQGLFTDLVTGFDDKQQVHRYQAVVVNVLLLIVGVSHVLQQLTYPVFDPTWLALLGVSGATLGVGKQLMENKPTSPTPPSGGAPNAASGVGRTQPGSSDGAVG